MVEANRKPSLQADRLRAHHEGFYRKRNRQPDAKSQSGFRSQPADEQAGLYRSGAGVAIPDKARSPRPVQAEFLRDRTALLSRHRHETRKRP